MHFYFLFSMFFVLSLTPFLSVYSCLTFLVSIFFFFVLCVFLRYFLHSVTTSKILISGIPLQTRFEDIEPLLKPYGIVKQCEAISSKDQNTQTVHITFENPEQAQRYINPNKHKTKNQKSRNRNRKKNPPPLLSMSTT